MLIIIFLHENILYFTINTRIRREREEYSSERILEIVFASRLSYIIRRPQCVRENQILRNIYYYIYYKIRETNIYYVFHCPLPGVWPGVNYTKNVIICDFPIDASRWTTHGEKLRKALCEKNSYGGSFKNNNLHRFNRSVSLRNTDVDGVVGLVGFCKTRVICHFPCSCTQISFSILMLLSAFQLYPINVLMITQHTPYSFRIFNLITHFDACYVTRSPSSKLLIHYIGVS